MNKLIRELRRREVFRTAGLYVGICWIAIEVASVVLPAFEAPDWTLRALIILAVVGFPVMIVLAWIYDFSEGGVHVQDEAVADAPVPGFGRRGDFIVIGVLSVALIFSVYMNIRDIGEPTGEVEPVSLLIANFENMTGDPVFDGSLEQALQIGMEGAPFVSTFRRSAAAEVAAQLSPDAVLDAATARLVAVREGIQLVIAGRIAPDGDGYRLEARVVEPRDGEAVAEADTHAEGKLQVLTAMEAIANELRRELGDETVGSADGAAETYTVRSLEAAREYDIAQALQQGGELEQAIRHYTNAIEHDPDFGRAYSGLAIAARGLGRLDQSQDAWDKAISLVGTMGERERLRTLGIYYYGVTRNYQKAIETYEELVEKYPADSVGHNNLAVNYFASLDFQNALREGKLALDIYPSDRLMRSNYALYAMYASDFETAVEQARRLTEDEDAYFKAWLPIAMQAIAEGDFESARAAYARMSEAGNRGASTASQGLADMALYAGDAADARAMLEEGIAIDEELGSSYGLATKYAALAEALLAADERDAALKALDDAWELAQADAVAVPAALVSIAAGEFDPALRYADVLAGKLQPQSRAYAGMIRALLALDGGDHLAAIDGLTAAAQLADLWLVRFYLGRAYLEGGFYAEALDEFMTAEARHGEATALFLDDLPTYRYAAGLPYWLARAQEGLGMTADAADNYRRYLARRGDGDALADDARQRIE